MRRSVLLAASLAAAVMTAGCSSENGCFTTEMDARSASLVDANNPLSSAVLEAKLTASGVAVPGKTVEFSIDQRGEQTFIGESQTNGDGIARLDLRTRPGAIASGVTGTSFMAEFGGDVTHCSSSDTAELGAVSG